MYNRFKPDRRDLIRDYMTAHQDAESTAVAYTHETPDPRRAERQRWHLVAFSGKRQRPDLNEWHQTEAGRAAKIERHRESVRRTENYRATRHAEAVASRKAAKGLDTPTGDYLSCANVAAFVRQVLKESFPGHKFSVTSSGSLNVRWTDGPSDSAVSRIVDTFAGSYFDGMIDYQGSIYHSLDGKRVSLGSTFVFTHREMSREGLEQGLAALAAAYPGTNHTPATITQESHWLKVEGNPEHPAAIEGRFPGEVELLMPKDSTWSTFKGARAALEAWHDSANPVPVQPSPTFARFRVIGSDGYGNTIDTPEGKPAGAGYAQFERDQMAKAKEEAAAEGEPLTFAPSNEGEDIKPRQPGPLERARDAVQPLPDRGGQVDLLDLVAAAPDPVRPVESVAEAIPRAVGVVIDLEPYLIERANAARTIH